MNVFYTNKYIICRTWAKMYFLTGILVYSSIRRTTKKYETTNNNSNNNIFSGRFSTTIDFLSKKRSTHTQ